MSSDNTNSKSSGKKKREIIITVCIIISFIVAIIFTIIAMHGLLGTGIKLSEIPREKLNQGYAIVCLNKEKNIACLINESGGIYVDFGSNDTVKTLNIWNSSKNGKLKIWLNNIVAYSKNETFLKSEWNNALTGMLQNETLHTDQMWVIWKGRLN